MYGVCVCVFCCVYHTKKKMLTSQDMENDADVEAAGTACMQRRAG
jgi:hypothetical protein